MFADVTAVACHNFTYASFLLFEYRSAKLALTLSEDGRDVQVFQGFHLDGTEDLSEEFDIPREWAKHAYDLAQARNSLDKLRGHFHSLLR